MPGANLASLTGFENVKLARVAGRFERGPWVRMAGAAAPAEGSFGMKLIGIITILYRARASLLPISIPVRPTPAYYQRRRTVPMARPREPELEHLFRRAGFGATDDESGLSLDTGVICVVMVRPDHRRKGIGRELVTRAERYLEAAGATSVFAGPAPRRDPFYVGLYGGSQPSGFLESDPDAAPFFATLGYEPVERHAVKTDLDVAGTLIHDRVLGVTEDRRRAAVDEVPECQPDTARVDQQATTVIALRLRQRVGKLLEFRGTPRDGVPGVRYWLVPVPVPVPVSVLLSAASAATKAAELTGYGVDARRNASAKSVWANRTPIRSAANPAAFEKVRATIRFDRCRIQGSTVMPENSKYASSTNTSVRGVASRIRSRASRSSSVPVGLFGFARNRMRGAIRKARTIASNGKRIVSS